MKPLSSRLTRESTKFFAVLQMFQKDTFQLNTSKNVTWTSAVIDAQIKAIQFAGITKASRCRYMRDVMSYVLRRIKFL